MLIFRPKPNRYRAAGRCGVLAGAGSSPSFGTLESSPAGAGGITARILEFSSPQIALLSPASFSPMLRKPSLPCSPMPPPSR